MKKNTGSLQRDVGEFIRRERIGKSLTGKEFGQLLNVSQQQVSRYENGKTNISIEMLDTILMVLELKWDDFFLTVIKRDRKSSSYFFDVN